MPFLSLFRDRVMLFGSISGTGQKSIKNSEKFSEALLLFN